MTTTPPTWTSVQDLPRNWPDLASDELGTLKDVWLEQTAHLRKGKALEEFNARLAREWAIETGVLEKLYTIDEGVSRLLVEQGLHASLLPQGATDQDPGYILNLIKDQHEVVEWLFEFVRADRPLGTSFIKEVHQLLTRHQDVAVAEDQFGRHLDVKLRKGSWRLQPTRIERLDDCAYQCCPPEQISSAMDTLLALAEQHRVDEVPTEIEAAWLHHRFAEIHPFQDGNGRVARALATLVFLRDGYFPLVVRRADREEYLRALYYADAGDLSALVDLFAKLQKRAFVAALGISQQVLKERAGLEDIVAAAADRLQERAQEKERRMAGVFDLANALYGTARDRFGEAAGIVNKGVGKIKREYRAWSDAAPNDTQRDNYFHFQIVAVAKQLNYFANTRTYRAWVRLGIITEHQTDVLLSIHCIGSQFQGVMAASAMTYRRERADDNANELSEIEALVDAPFLFTYSDREAALKARFSKWLDQVLALGLDMWRRSL